MNAIVAKAKTTYPRGFIGPASFNVEDIQLVNFNVFV